MYHTVRTSVCAPVDRLARLIIVWSPFRDATSTESLSSHRMGHSLPGMVGTVCGAPPLVLTIISFRSSRTMTRWPSGETVSLDSRPSGEMA